MKLYSGNDEYKLYQGNMLDMLEVIEPHSIDSIITDPPYELNFMGKGWDNSGIAFQKETWEQCYKVLKSGGYLLAFGGSRTFHRIACAIEDAGFEIRDTIMWLYGSGFPKSLNIGLAIDKKNGVESKVVGFENCGKNAMLGGLNDKQTNNGSYDIKEAQNEWKGWGTALKPSYEPIIVARKPVENTVVYNVLKYGVGGINIDECRVGNETISIHNAPKGTFAGGEYNRGSDTSSYRDSTGRFPANTILTYDDTDFKEVCGGFPYTTSTGGSGESSIKSANNFFTNSNDTNNKAGNNLGGLGDSGSASRYFYCAKASKKDRDDGLDKFEEIDGGSYQFRQDGSLDGKIPVRKNIHPTVKPMELIQYLIRLVSPKGATILDCFNGSGSTGKAVMYENAERNSGYKYIGIELTDEYLPISKARIESVYNKKTQTSLF